MRTSGSIEVGPIGPTLQNGMAVGGNNIYPYSKSLAFSPPAQFSTYIGSASGNPITPPVSALRGTTGVIGPGANPDGAKAMASPFGKHSPLPWLVGFLLLALLVMHRKGYGK